MARDLHAHDERGAPPVETIDARRQAPVRAGWPAEVSAALAGVAAGFIASGAAGFMAHALRHALAWLCFMAIIVVLWPVGWRRRGLLLAGLAAATLLTRPESPVLNLLAVALLLGVAGLVHARPSLALRSATWALIVLALYRLLLTSVPAVWYAADGLARVSGHVAALVARQPLEVGPTFAALDLLLLPLALYVIWLCHARPRMTEALTPLLLMLGAQGLWLVGLAYAPLLQPLIPDLPPPGEMDSVTGRPGLPVWAAILKQGVPWGLLVFPAVLQWLISGLLLRRLANIPSPSAASPKLNSLRPGRRSLAVVVALAVALGVLTSLTVAPLTLSGKNICVYEKGFLNWLRPKHGEYGHLSIGMYGLLGDVLGSLGAKMIKSPALSEADLSRADAVVLLFPDQEWEPGQRERLWAYVRQGGTLLVFGEHTTRDLNGSNRFNEILSPTGMQVEFDCGTWAVGGWLHCYQAMAHPATLGLGDERNVFGSVIGASLRTRWPARPLLLGRWGWSDLGDPAGSAMMGNQLPDVGERLGDIILAAEQPLGRGRVIAFGDTSTMTNGLVPGTYPFVSRLLAYAAGGRCSLQAPWRGLLAMLAAPALLGILWLRPQASVLAVAVLALTLCLCTGFSSSRAGGLLPDGTARSPNNVAYIDVSHAGAHSDEAWRADGLMGLTLTLMRNGYVVFDLPEVTWERLRRAGLVISVAPARGYSGAERAAIRRFVEGGGSFLLTVGYEESRPSQSLLRDFGFQFPYLAQGGPAPLGHFKSPYLRDGSTFWHVRFHAGWPLEATTPGASVVAYGAGNEPVFLSRPLGRGHFAVVADTCFAMNKNLENEGGESFEGMRENADFWRWFLTWLRGQEQWIPARPETGQQVCPVCGQVHAGGAH